MLQAARPQGTETGRRLRPVHSPPDKLSGDEAGWEPTEPKRAVAVAGDGDLGDVLRLGIAQHLSDQRTEVLLVGCVERSAEQRQAILLGWRQCSPGRQSPERGD